MREAVESVVTQRREMIKEIESSPLKDDARVASLCSPSTPEEDQMDKVFHPLKTLVFFFNSNNLSHCFHVSLYPDDGENFFFFSLGLIHFPP